MSIQTAFHESLPYIDPEPTQQERAAAEAEIANELATFQPPELPPFREPKLSPLIEAELERISRKEPLQAIDLSRYEAQELPSASTSTSSEDPSAAVDALASTLRKAHASHTYLTTRLQNLRLLDKWGRNAWLLGNYALETDLRALEKDLAHAKAQIDVLNIARRRAQDDAAGEMASLADAWRRGVARVLETEVAVENLRKEVLVEMHRRARMTTATATAG
ncbi:breast carcinoma amplified sequence 2 [Sodiomyces alkalinus F11]|uniref:Breast carcinoma amplified sequence 2 n=1 Tax=Sodiomyces alkalinus (strain CBS 110278 / VKM F-3762 / F11) TaxID=1314773 RepID=A0A3N2PT72_SODAK|nr:breast carcinoma amplified sequence 2 [Sodiomyces alkalinus F11]ROT37700.1 breast carcinoma amplified sequence 2 [Sodiomyces alkalinus F11]